MPKLQVTMKPAGYQSPSWTAPHVGVWFTFGPDRAGYGLNADGSVDTTAYCSMEGLLPEPLARKMAAAEEMHQALRRAWVTFGNTTSASEQDALRVISAALDLAEGRSNG